MDRHIHVKTRCMVSSRCLAEGETMMDDLFDFSDLQFQDGPLKIISRLSLTYEVLRTKFQHVRPSSFGTNDLFDPSDCGDQDSHHISDVSMSHA